MKNASPKTKKIHIRTRTYVCAINFHSSTFLMETQHIRPFKAKSTGAQRLILQGFEGFCTHGRQWGKKKIKKILKKGFTNPKSCDNIYLADEATATEAWGISAVGSAQHWQCWGQEFESPMLHQMRSFQRRISFFVVFGGIVPLLAFPLEGKDLRSADWMRGSTPPLPSPRGEGVGAADG